MRRFRTTGASIRSSSAGPYALRCGPEKAPRLPPCCTRPWTGPTSPSRASRPIAVLLSRYGQEGRLFAEALGVFFSETYMSTAEQRFQPTLAHCCQVYPARAPRSVTMNVYRQPQQGRLLIHLVNNGHDARPVSEFRPSTTWSSA